MIHSSARHQQSHSMDDPNAKDTSLIAAAIIVMSLAVFVVVILALIA